METPDQNWKVTARMNCLPDTAEARQAFYHGARYALSALVDAISEDGCEAALALNDHLGTFGRAALSHPPGETT
jgi:hypothetical protein